MRYEVCSSSERLTDCAVEERAAWVVVVPETCAAFRALPIGWVPVEAYGPPMDPTARCEETALAGFAAGADAPEGAYERLRAAWVRCPLHHAPVGVTVASPEASRALRERTAPTPFDLLDLTTTALRAYGAGDDELVAFLVRGALSAQVEADEFTERFRDGFRRVLEDLELALAARARPTSVLPGLDHAAGVWDDRQSPMHEDPYTSLVARGDGAVPDLIECLRDDQRATRWIVSAPMFHYRVVSKWYLCALALADVWDDPYLAEWPRERLLQHAIDRAEQHAGRSRAWRQFDVLNDDNAAPQRWLVAANWLSEEVFDGAARRGDEIGSEEMARVLRRRVDEAHTRQDTHAACGLAGIEREWVGRTSSAWRASVGRIAADDCECAERFVEEVTTSDVVRAWVGCSQPVDTDTLRALALRHGRLLRRAFDAALATDSFERRWSIAWRFATVAYGPARDWLRRAFRDRSSRGHVVVAEERRWVAVDPVESVSGARRLRTRDVVAWLVSRHLELELELDGDDVALEASVQAIEQALERTWGPKPGI